jgi:hypothetical protein
VLTRSKLNEPFNSTVSSASVYCYTVTSRFLKSEATPNRRSDEDSMGGGLKGHGARMSFGSVKVKVKVKVSLCLTN